MAPSGCMPRARSSCIAVPIPPHTMSTPRARHAVMTNSNWRRPERWLERPARQQRRRQQNPQRRDRQARPSLAVGPCGERTAGDVEKRVGIPAAGRRNPHVPLPAHPEQQRGDAHQDPGNAERHGGPVPAKEDRHQQRGKETAEVDRPVERVEDDFREGLVRLAELVAHEGHDKRLDAARSEARSGRGRCRSLRGCRQTRPASRARRSRSARTTAPCGTCRSTGPTASRPGAERNTRR